MATIPEKTARLEAARKNVEAFVAKGGDLKSPAAVPVGLELVNAFADLAKDFGYEILKPMKKPADFIRPDPASVKR
jgi:hypothetical protein